MKTELKDISSITDLIPQRAPVICIDRLLNVSETSATTSFTIPSEFIFVKNGNISAAGLLENVAQSAAAKAGYYQRLNHDKITLGYIAAFKQVEIFMLPKIGVEIISHVEFIQSVLNMSVFRVEIKCNEKRVLIGEMNIITE
jgi:predicted hotdog family 3-hydroxylacyl-ACP dehydratase